MKTVLIIAFTDAFANGRINRQIRCLSEHYRVTVASLTDPYVPGVQFIACRQALMGNSSKFVSAMELLRGQYERHYWRIVADVQKKIAHLQPDLIIANGIETLPLALHLARTAGAKLLFDAPASAMEPPLDAHPRERLFAGYRRYLCTTYIPQVDAMTTSSQGLAAHYAALLHITPEVVTDAPDDAGCEPTLRPASQQQIRLVCYGPASRWYAYERLCALMDALDERFTLDMLLMPQGVAQHRYFKQLMKQLEKHSRIEATYLTPQKMLFLISEPYDIGVMLQKPASVNQRYLVPEPFFAYLQARLALAVGPSTEMEQFVRECECGVTASSFEPAALAQVLQPLDHRTINRYKQRSHAWMEHKPAAENCNRLLHQVEQLLDQ
jgi:hypothetical protein